MLRQGLLDGWLPQRNALGALPAVSERDSAKRPGLPKSASGCLCSTCPPRSFSSRPEPGPRSDTTWQCGPFSRSCNRAIPFGPWQMKSGPGGLRRSGLCLISLLSAFLPPCELQLPLRFPVYGASIRGLGPRERRRLVSRLCLRPQAFPEQRRHSLLNNAWFKDNTPGGYSARLGFAAAIPIFSLRLPLGDETSPSLPLCGLELTNVQPRNLDPGMLPPSWRLGLVGTERCENY